VSAAARRCTKGGAKLAHASGLPMKTGGNKVVTRRRFLRVSVFGCGAAAATEKFGRPLIRHACAGSAASPIASTSLGKLRGGFAEGIYSFKGVHYGSSTAGARRFLPPEPPKPWKGLRDALQMGPPRLKTGRDCLPPGPECPCRI